MTVASSGNGLTAEERELVKRAIDRARRRELRIITAELFLLEALERGPRLHETLFVDARAVGLAKASVKTAAKRLRLLERPGRGGRPAWALPPQPDDGSTTGAWTEGR